MNSLSLVVWLSTGGCSRYSKLSPQLNEKPVESPSESQQGEITPKALLGVDETLKSTVNQYASQLLYCYEKIIKIDPSVEGRIEVGWVVSAGVVTGIPYIVANTTGNAELADCVTKKIKRWTFPTTIEGDVSWPFAFKPR